LDPFNAVTRGLVTDGVTAKAGGGQAGTLITTHITKVTTVASAGDSLLLPAGSPGIEAEVLNGTGTSLNVFPQVGGLIDNGSPNAAVAIPGNKMRVFRCASANPDKWHSNLTA
jgi:hypothetical protein